jgi:hypothetical protein
MRKQINGLVVIIEQVMEANVFEPSLFLFCNGERRILKAVYWVARLCPVVFAIS